MPRRKIFSRRSSPRGFRLPLGLLFVVVLITLCLLIPSTPLNLAGQDITEKPMPTLPVTFTKPPPPTKEHIGRLVFTCSRGDYNQLCMTYADGTGYQQLSTLEANSYYPVFSPQGGSIVYASNQNGGVFDLYLYTFEGSQLTQLTTNIGNAISPTFSPDGKTILFANRTGEGPTSLWTVDTAGQNPNLLYSGPSTIVAVDWSPKGDQIAFAMAVDRPDAYEIFLMNADGTNVRQLTHNLPNIGGSVDWSPDGRFLLIYAGPQGDRNIFMVDVAAETASQLTNGGNNASAVFSPDGQWIAFISLRNNDQADIFIMRPNGSEMRPVVTNPEPDWQPQWEP
jgi:Tol biopolymer transport system component